MTQRRRPVAGHPHLPAPVPWREKKPQRSREPQLSFSLDHTTSIPWDRVRDRDAHELERLPAGLGGKCW
jgi:hypothetical protein